MHWLRRHAEEMGLLGLTLVAVSAVLAAALLYFGARPPIENQVGCVVNCGPAIPPELADHQERAGLERGSSVGATPSQALPRPDGLFSSYVWKGSPNWSGRGTCYPQAIVLHVTGPGTMAGMASWFNNPSAAVSAHFGIGKAGEVQQYVEVGDAAWHAGIVNRPNLANPLIADWVATGVNPNRCTVGIELLLAGPAEPLVEYPAMQASLNRLLGFIHDSTGIPLDRTHVIGHYEIDAVNRATDPRCCVSIDDVLAGLGGSGSGPAPATSPASTVSDCSGDTDAFGNTWDSCLKRWVAANGWRYNPDLGEWELPNGVHEWSACVDWGGRYNFNRAIWMHVSEGFYADERGFWSVAPPC